MDPPKPRRLWHYCCLHSVDGIVKDDLIKPHPGGVQTKVTQITGFTVLAMPVVWLTDLNVTTVSEAQDLGLDLKTELVSCNRVEFRFRVSSSVGIWWPDWADQAVEDGVIHAKYREALELDRTPERWWVSEKPIRSPHLDERYRGIALT
jgi:hypothetical protein